MFSKHLRPIFQRTLCRSPLRYSSQFQQSNASFTVITDPMEHDTTQPQFMVGTHNGFLPRIDPLVTLPKEFEPLERILNEAPIELPGGKEGLLAHGKLGETVLKSFPLLEVSHITDSRLLNALFRDYTYLASAYVLEPCDINYRKNKDYGLGRDVLPKSIAVPLCKVSEKMRAKPFMEYALSYALYNYKRKDAKGPLSVENMELIRKFHGTSSEAGFVLVHVAMVAHTGALVSATLETLDAAEKKDRPAFEKALKSLNNTMMRINAVMETMWLHSLPEDYDRFRSFIMGIKNQPMFPKGLLYEGVSNEYQAYRGESGANDSIIPTMDNLLQLTQKMPNNPLTEILKDFRTYRPHNHTEFVASVEERANKAGIAKFAKEDPNTAVLYMANCEQVREFRYRHWLFTKEYIMKYSDHPVATGGSPITTWLPNQLKTVMEAIVEIGDNIDSSKLNPEMKALKESLRMKADLQAKVLTKEVEVLKKQYKDQDLS